MRTRTLSEMEEMMHTGYRRPGKITRRRKTLTEKQRFLAPQQIGEKGRAAPEKKEAALKTLYSKREKGRKTTG